MHHRVERSPVLVDPEHGFEHLAEIGKIDAHAWADRVSWQRLIDVEDLVAVRHQILQHRPAELAATACDQNLCHAVLLVSCCWIGAYLPGRKG